MTAPAAETGEEGQGAEVVEEKTFTQAQLNKLLAGQKREIESKFAGFDDIRSKAEQFDALTETSKTEVQRATEAAAQAAKERDEAKAELAERDTAIAQRDIAAKNNLDPNLWEFIKGATTEEITESVKKLLSHSSPKRPTGLRSGASNEGIQSKQERAVEALRSLNQR